MGILSIAYALTTGFLIVSSIASLALWGLACLKHIIPNTGDELLVVISQKVLRLSKYITFFAFLAFVILSVVMAGAEAITYGKVTNPVLTLVAHVVTWIANRMTQLANRLFPNFQYCDGV